MKKTLTNSAKPAFFLSEFVTFFDLFFKKSNRGELLCGHKKISKKQWRIRQKILENQEKVSIFIIGNFEKRVKTAFLIF
ncbi:hypothetical protein D7004_04600 [Pedobacter jejuensis]|uniref:Uncharacterized protein n=1 Tax=Pedobacter jejuensis TaxID=1268550 RepID=A0A3N0C090_9SPHI|nr:hypothetical protein D7004_04600 [Pedobacter jejuensis]